MVHKKDDQSTLLFLVIAYNNTDEVHDYLNQINQLINRDDHKLVVGIADNYGNFDANNLEHLSYSVFVVRPEKNLGYLGGCNLAFNQYMETNELPTWVSISNTDLILPENILDIFKNVNSTVGQLSPMVVTTSGHRQNPHIIQTPGTSYYRKQKLIHKSSFIGAFHILLSGYKSKYFRKNETKPIDVSHRISQFAAHGSIFFLSQSYFSKGGTIANGPFLYGEEIYVGEQLISLNCSSVCNPNFKVIHAAHTTTSKFLSLRKKSRMLGNSFHLVYDMFKDQIHSTRRKNG